MEDETIDIDELLAQMDAEKDEDEEASKETEVVNN